MPVFHCGLTVEPDAVVLDFQANGRAIGLKRQSTVPRVRVAKTIADSLMSHAVQMNGLLVGELLRRARIHLKREVQPVRALQGLYELGQRSDELIAAQTQRILPLDIAADIRDDL